MEEKIDKKEESTKESEYVEQIQRLQAEFENFTKRSEKEKSEIIKNANEELITELLRILDNFELALKHTDDKGVNMIYSELYSVLEKEGLKLIGPEKKFNPEIHEVLIQEEAEIEKEVLEELQKGYTLNDKVIRPVKIKIIKPMEKKNE